jgi:hypothetical protein
MNHYFAEYVDSMLVIEPVIDGIVYIFKNRKSFDFIHNAIPQSVMQKIDDELKIPQNPKLTLLPSIEEVPKSGLYLRCDFTNISFEDAFIHMKIYYTSIDPSIVLTKQENQLLINFITPISALRYLGVLSIGNPYQG